MDIGQRMEGRIYDIWKTDVLERVAMAMCKMLLNAWGLSHAQEKVILRMYSKLETGNVAVMLGE
jgi:hypothetical protein